MLKYILLIAGNIFLLNNACSQTIDTLRFYFREGSGGAYSVSNPDSADFVRLILPPDSGDNLTNVKEFYRNGALKLAGKTEYKYFESFNKTTIILEGNRVSFYPSGRKEKVVTLDQATGLSSEYKYYPNGKLYNYTSYKSDRDNSQYDTRFFECHNSTGDFICKDGNGQWIVYDFDYKNIVLSGNIKNGAKDGEWQGVTIHNDSIRYAYKYVYKNGILLHATGFDKQGNAYPFTQETVIAQYREGPIEFLDLFMGHLKIPKDINGKRISTDSLYVSFIIEKNGHLTNLKVIGNTDPLLTNALNAALAKSPNWNPTKLWGIPLRTQITFPLNDFKSVDNSSPTRNILFKITLLE